MYKCSARSNRVQRIFAQGHTKRGTVNISLATPEATLLTSRGFVSQFYGTFVRRHPPMKTVYNFYGMIDQFLVHPLKAFVSAVETYEVGFFDLVDLALYEQVKVEHAAAQLKPAPETIATGVMIRRATVSARVEQRIAA